MGTYTDSPPTFVAGVAAGSVAKLNNLRDFARSFTDPWASYTPTLTASTTNPTNWTGVGRYQRSGKLIIAKFKLTAGGSMTAGSGTYRIALPANADTTIGDVEVGQVTAFDSSTNAWGLVTPYLANAAYLQLGFSTTLFGAFAAVGHAAPWTWAANDFIRGTIVYEAA